MDDGPASPDNQSGRRGIPEWLQRGTFAGERDGDRDKSNKALLTDAAAERLSRLVQVVKTRAAAVVQGARGLLAEAEKARNPAISTTPSPVVSPAQRGAPQAPSAAKLPPEDHAPSATPVTDRALASIVEIRQRIQPEFPAGGMVSLIPSLVIMGLVIVIAIGAFSLARHVFFPQSYFGAPAYPGYPQNPYAPQRR